MEEGKIYSTGTVGIGNTYQNPNFLYTSTSNVGLGILNPNQTLIVNSNKMKQVKAALFSVTRDEKTNDIIDSEFVKEFWVKVKPGVSFEVAAAWANGFAPDPDREVIREILTVHF